MKAEHLWRFVAVVLALATLSLIIPRWVGATLVLMYFSVREQP